MRGALETLPPLPNMMKRILPIVALVLFAAQALASDDPTEGLQGVVSWPAAWGVEGCVDARRPRGHCLRRPGGPPAWHVRPDLAVLILFLSSPCRST